MRPHRQQPTRLWRLWDSPGKNTRVGCHFLLQCMKVKSESEVAQSCPTLSDPMDCSLPGSSIHGIFQARVLEWVGIAFCEKTLATWKESDDPTRQHIKKQRQYYANKDLSSQGYGLSMCHVWMWKLNYKECWPPKIWCFWTVVLENMFEGCLDYKETLPLHPKGTQAWIYIGRTNMNLKLQYFGHLIRRADSFGCHFDFPVSVGAWPRCRASGAIATE